MSDLVDSPQNTISPQQWEERRSAMRCILQQKLLHTSQNGDLFVLIRRHRDWLRQWFTDHPGWSLHIDAEIARLRATPSRLLGIDHSHPARDLKQKTAFSRKRYTCLCLCLASLEKAGRQITLGRMAEDVLTMIHNDEILKNADIHLDLDARSDRADLVSISRKLVSLRVLERISGDEESYLKSQGERNDCLYTIHRDALSRILCVQVGPSMVFEDDFEKRMLALQTENCGQSDAEQRRDLRRHLIRALLSQPVVYYNDLPEDAALYLRHQQTHLVSELCHATGLIAEQRQEGIALVDDNQDMSDFRLPQEGTEGHAALLICERLSQALKEGRKSIPHSEIEAFLGEQAKIKGKSWRQDTQTAEGLRLLCHHILDRLEALGLLKQSADSLEALPAIARYALREKEKNNGDVNDSQDSSSEQIKGKAANHSNKNDTLEPNLFDFFS